MNIKFNFSHTSKRIHYSRMVLHKQVERNQLISSMNFYFHPSFTVECNGDVACG